MADNKDIAGAAGQNAGTPPGISDPLSNRETDTGNLDKLDDTRTRKTIKLRPMGSGAPKMKYTDVAASPDGAEQVADPLSQRHTNTGSFAKLDDTRTRKTIKMSPGGSMKPSFADADAKTVELKPIRTEQPPAAAEEEMETATVPVSKLSPAKGGVPQLIPESEKVPITPGPARTASVPVPAPAVAPAPAAEEEEEVETPTVPVNRVAPTKAGAPQLVPGNLKPVIPATPAAPPVQPPKPISTPPPAAATASSPIDIEDTRTRKTIRISKSSVHEAAESVMPSVAQAKTISSGDTIRLRPAESGSAAPVMPQSSAKDTIKLKPGGTGSAAPPPSASPSASTVALKPGAPLKPAAPSAPLKPPAAVTPGAATGAKIGLKTQQKPAETPPAASTPPPTSAGGEQKKSGGLGLKKIEETGAPKGPPRAQQDQAAIQDKKGRRKGAGSGPSTFYTAVGIFTFFFLLFSTYVTAANYINTWEQSRFEEPIHFPIPVLEDRINLR